MSEIEKLKLADIKKKNGIALGAFSISIISALILAFVEGNLVKTGYYGSEFVLSVFRQKTPSSIV